jgi:hypothetical protein
VLPNSDVAPDEALAALGTSRENAIRYADREYYSPGRRFQFHTILQVFGADVPSVPRSKLLVIGLVRALRSTLGAISQRNTHPSMSAGLLLPRARAQRRCDGTCNQLSPFVGS